MTEKRLLIAAEIFPPAVGGPATYAATLARELPKRGWQVTVVCYADGVAGAYPATIIPVSRRGGAVVRYWRYLRTLWRLAKDFPIIYAQGPVSSGLPALLVAKLRRKKLVVKVTGDYAWEQAFQAGATKVFIEEFQRQRIGGKYGLMRFIEKQVCRSADQIVAPSEFLKHIVAGWKVEPKRIAVIWNASNFPAVSKDRATLRSQYGIAADDFLLLSVGRAVPWKGFGLLGKVVSELFADYPVVRLTCVGITTGELAKMMADAGSHVQPDGQRIIGTGPVANDQVHEWLQCADLFVLNTAYEGLSHVILEAMAVGVTVVTTEVGGNSELIKHGYSGILVGFDDAADLKRSLVEMITQPALRDTLAEAARGVLGRSAVSEMIHHTDELLYRIIPGI